MTQINEHLALAISRVASGRAEKSVRLSGDEAEQEWKANGNARTPDQAEGRRGSGGPGGGREREIPILNTPGGGPAGARIPVRPVGDAPLRSGSVVDSFAQGPNNFAIERYQLNGAEPNTTYQIQLVISLHVTDCSVPPIIQPSVPLKTNAQGNGQASIRVPPEFIPAVAKGNFNSLYWQFLKDGEVRYDTQCVGIWEDLDEERRGM